MRSEDNATPSVCEDTDVKVVCAVEAAAGEYDKCPAACREAAEDNAEETVVKSGSLQVTATAAAGRSAIRNATSDLDTLKFKTSEPVSITKVTLERYGYSSSKDLSGVWLEDEDGNMIAEAKGLNSKDQVTLSIKKDYRSVDGSFNATIVAELKDGSGSTIGFKVVDVTSTAKDVDLGDYSPYTYDIVNYDAVSDVTIDDKDTDKDYNYEAGELYQVAKLKVKASNSPITVNGFTLTNSGNLDLEDFLDDVEVSVDGKALKGTSYKLDDRELTISFDAYEIAAKQSVTFTVKASLEDFDEYGDKVQFQVKASTDVKMVEKKTGARVSVDGTPTTGGVHAFNGSKIKLSSTKLGNVDAAQGSDDVVVLSGAIELSEGVDRIAFEVEAEYSTGEDVIENMRLFVAGEEYEAGKAYTAGATGATFSFSDIEIEKSGKVQILIDIDDDTTPGTTIKFIKPTAINKNAIATGDARYTDAKSPVLTGEVSGSISFATKVTVQASKASLENDLTKDVQFVALETSRKVVFDGTYTAKKGDVYLNTAEITGAYDNDAGDLTFYVYVDGDELVTIDAGDPEEEFTDILVKAGKSVKIKVEAEAYPELTGKTYDFKLVLGGVDENDNPAGNASEDLVTIKFVEKGSVIVSSNTTAKDTILLKAKNTNLATFTVKPSNGNEGLTLENLILKISGDALKLDDVKVKVAGVEYEAEDDTLAQSEYVINEELPTDGLKVEVVLKSATTGEVVFTVVNANDATTALNKEFTKMYADTLVYIASQKKDGDVTRYTLGVEKYDEDDTITGVYFYTGADCSGTPLDTGLGTSVEDGDTFSIVNGETAQTIKAAKWNGTCYESADYADYFKVGGESWMVFSNK